MYAREQSENVPFKEIYLLVIYFLCIQDLGKTVIHNVTVKLKGCLIFL